VKQKILTSIVFFALPQVTFGQEWERVDMGGWDTYGTMTFAEFDAGEGYVGIRVSGTTSGGSGYVIEAADLGFEGKKQIMIRISGVEAGKDRYDHSKLFKLELDNRPVVTDTVPMKNRNDNRYMNARNGECVFPIPAPGRVRKIELVFYNCTLSGLKLEMFMK
jgi:hypothetical protein